MIEVKFQECLSKTNFHYLQTKTFVCGLHLNSLSWYLYKVLFSVGFLSFLQHQRPSTYDRINHVVEGYDQKLHRDDREHAKSRGLQVNSEVRIFFHFENGPPSLAKLSRDYNKLKCIF